jgi:phosphoribosylformylglycinamidine cyclo-ligase
MYKVFNMGHRMEVYLPEKFATEVIAVSNSFGIEARIVGFVEASEKKELVIESEKGKYFYH